MKNTAFALLFCLEVLSAASLRVDDRRSLNGSFEAVKDGMPAGWTVTHGAATADATAAHDGKLSLRLKSPTFTETRVESPAIQLTIGRTYEVSAWLRTQALDVRDVDRSPIAAGASISMASLPFDYHSESVGGTREWTRVHLRFVATRSEDRIVCLTGLGGEARGTAWFDGVSIDEVSTLGSWPARAAVETFGPAYRYPNGGWIYLHIEGAPYERGYQHGYLLSKEIGQYLNRCALMMAPKAKESGWDLGRTTANALFLRGFDKEILEEMKGIADGAAARGLKWGDRPIDLVDVVTMNTLTEVRLLTAALPMTPTGLEGLNLRRPDYFDPKRDVAVTERCSAFAATGSATKDHKMVIGHITMWPLTLAEQTNIMLDIKPATGHRILMQSYPAGIQSGTDYYQNDAGIVLTETTIRQSPFNAQGTPIAYRARKAIQYASTVEEVADYLGNQNNGMYTNEWLIGDAKNDQIAMYELGTYKTKLYRSSKNEWFGGTQGFYWGCNNAKDLNVRLEYVPDPKGKPVHLPFVPEPRDIKWQELYQRHKGNIDEQFAFLAFRTPPLVSSSAFDAKMATKEMASRLMCWAVFGKPNQREWVPSAWEREMHPVNNGIYSSGYRLFRAAEPDTLQTIVRDNEKERLAGKAKPAPKESEKNTSGKNIFKDQLWQGWVLPESDGDVWLTAGSAAYYRVLDSKEWQQELESHRAAFRAAALKAEFPLRRLSGSTTSANWFEIAANKGVLLLDGLRHDLGDEKFFRLMKEFFEKNTTRRVSSAQFEAAAEKVNGKPMQAFFTAWLDNTGVPNDPKPGAIYVSSALHSRLPSALLVYGTVQDAGANRYAAEVLQKRFLDWYEGAVPILKDFEISDADLARHDIVFVGRPESNSALAHVQEKLGLAYEGATFRLDGAVHASENESLMLAAANPLNSAYMALILAGNSALETVRLASLQPENYEYTVYDAGKRTAFGFQKR